LFDINNIITHPVLDTTRYVNIKVWVSNGEKTSGDQISPLQLSRELDSDNARLQVLINKLKASNLSAGAAAEVNDLQAWYWFGKYFSDKVKAAVALARYRYKNDDRREEAITYLKGCSGYWMNYGKTITKYNKESFPFIIARGDYSWKEMQLQVDKDIDLAKESYPKK
jgi:phosphodiesterase/alkaline phosphatase D-like protein